ncbi:MAG: GNAT family N-acetyltransferase [Alphaproteobacteria bacterium]|nr:GNAT family N-acetyltransferase [Alphaproteobacteria bacterium]
MKSKNKVPITKHQAQYFIRPARLEDFEEIYGIFCQILDEGMTYSYTREEMTPERSLAYWMTAPDTHCYVADVGGKVAGIATIRRNRTGRAEHVANASFIVHPEFRGIGIAKALGGHALKTAKKLGYKAMQFNFVVSTNEVAVKLWQSLGMKIVGTLPKGFRHAKKGYVDVYVMHQFL